MNANLIDLNKSVKIDLIWLASDVIIGKVDVGVGVLVGSSIGVSVGIVIIGIGVLVGVLVVKLGVGIDVLVGVLVVKLGVGVGIGVDEVGVDGVGVDGVGTTVDGWMLVRVGDGTPVDGVVDVKTTVSLSTVDALVFGDSKINASKQELYTCPGLNSHNHIKL